MSILAASSSFVVRITAPRGPHSVLWVVKVITSAMPTGLGKAPATTMPAGWLMSARRTAPISWAMSANACQSGAQG